MRLSLDVSLEGLKCFFLPENGPNGCPYHWHKLLDLGSLYILTLVSCRLPFQWLEGG